MSDYDGYASEEEDEDFVSHNEVHHGWHNAHYEAIVELWAVYKETGRKLFGNAFEQLGNLNKFSYFVYKNTVL